MHHSCIENAIDQFDKPNVVSPISKEILTKYEKIMPPILLDMWQQEGFCQFQNGLYYIVNPDDWQDVVDVWIDNTPYQKLGQFYALARNAFGYLYVYNPDTGTKLTISTILSTISGSIRGYFTDKEKEISIEGFFGLTDWDKEDFTLLDNKPIFKKAVKKLGPLGWYEMYAFEPAFALIGDAALTMDNLVKVDARIHMLLLRDLIDQPKIWSFNIEEDLKRIGTSLAEIAEKHRP